MISERKVLLAALRWMYLCGFNASSEGNNGEYPWGDFGKDPKDDVNWRKHRDTCLQTAERKILNGVEL